MDFVALDFETANADCSSVCQVGVVTFQAGEPVDTFTSLIDPGTFFDPINVLKHGIDETAVQGAPAFPTIHENLTRRVRDRIVACHTAFDRAIFRQVHAKYGLDAASCRWFDTAMVARRAWPQYAQTGYGLGNLASEFGIEFKHHDAGEDARAAGMVLLRAMQETGMTPEEWLVRAAKPLTTKWQPSVTRDGNPDGPLYGEILVFTGSLATPRAKAADLAAAAGCEVDDNVTKKTTLLVVGDQDIAVMAPGQTKSGKHRRAEEYIAKGRPIRILREADFAAMCELAATPEGESPAWNP